MAQGRGRPAGPFAPCSFKGGQIGELEEAPGVSAGAWQMRPLSRGYCEAKSNRPGEVLGSTALSVKETDRRAIIGGLHLVFVTVYWYYGDSLLIPCPAIGRKKRVG